MKLPQVPEPQTSTLTTSVWLGYNHNLRIQQGELYHMRNMSCDNYPVLSTRKMRGRVRPLDPEEQPSTAIAECKALMNKEQLAWVDGNILWYAGHNVMQLGSYQDPPERILVSMGSYIVVFPDGMYYNTLDTADKGSINNSYVNDDVSLQNIGFTLCSADFESVEATVSDTAPKEPANGDYWINTGATPNTLMQWSSYSSQWTVVPTTYVKISAPGIGNGFNAYDGVSLSGFAYTGAGEMAETLRDQIDALNGDYILQAADTDYIIVIGMLSSPCSQTSGTVNVKREAPLMDFVVESNNRLWGCKFGMVGSETVNTIYSSKLGDFKNWRVYEGLSTDSYAASVGADGPFTGAITYKNLPHFFKESCVYQVYGTMPSNYQIVHTKIPGVKSGSPRSLVSEGGYIFYRSPVGICQYDGSNAHYISQALGDQLTGDVTAGAFDGKLWFCWYTGGTGTPVTYRYSIFCYDVAKGFWTREDDTRAYYWASTERDLYFVSTYGFLYCVNGTEGTKETFVGNNADYSEIMSAPIGYEDPNQKYLTRFNIRVGLTSGARLELYIMYDSSGTFVKQGAEFVASAKELRTYMIPVTPHRCDHLQWMIKVSNGLVDLYSVSKTYESGSDVT